MRDKRKRVDSEKAASAAAREEKKKQGTAKKLAPRTKSKGKEIGAISLEEEPEEFCLMVTVMKLWMRRWVIYRGQRRRRRIHL